jgi:hypothetical protein
LLGRHLGIGSATVARAWRKYRVQPWWRETFKFSTDPELEAKVRDVVGLYLNPPTNAIVLCVDEKSQIQALNRTTPILPVRPGLPQRATHRHDHAVRRAGGGHRQGHRPVLRAARQGRVPRLPQEGRPRPPTPRTARRAGQLPHPQALRDQHVAAQTPRITLHFTPTSGSWLNLVEVFFGIITRQAIRRGSFDSVTQLVTAIGTFIDDWNDRCHPFIWTKTADQILPHATRKRDSDAGR